MDDFDWLSDAEVFALAAKRLAALAPTTDGEREAREALAKTEEPPRHVHSWRLVCDRGHEVAGSSAETEPPHWATWSTRCEECDYNFADENAYDFTVTHHEWDLTPDQKVDADHLRTALALLAAERAKAAALSAEVAELRDPDARYRAFLDWRGVETPCPTCSGSGRRGYGNTSTWRRGAGGCAITDDVCDACWGTGDAERKGADLRAKAADAAREQEPWVCDCGLPMSRNPHPDAGKPAALLNVGAVWVCIPCTVKSRHGATTARFQAERDRDGERAAIVARVQAVVDTLTSNDTYNVGRRDALTWLIRELSPKETP